MRRGYISRRIAQTMRASRPPETPDTDAATVYAQRWRLGEGKSFRHFNVLALDAEMATEMGGIRLVSKYNQDLLEWTLVDNRSCERNTSMVIAVLQAEHPDETKLRERRFLDRVEASV